jgi:hypothetical protein
MESTPTWSDIPDLDKLMKKAKKSQPKGRSYKDEVILLDLSCTRKQLPTSSKEIDAEENCAIEITNKRIRIFEDDDFSDVKRKIKISKINQIFINKSHDEVLLNTDKASTRILETDLADEVVSTILAVLGDDIDNVVLYEVPAEDMLRFADDLDDPPDTWEVSIGRSSENFDNADEGAEVRKVRSKEMNARKFTIPILKYIPIF